MSHFRQRGSSKGLFGGVPAGQGWRGVDAGLAACGCGGCGAMGERGATVAACGLRLMLLGTNAVVTRAGQRPTMAAARCCCS